MSADVQQFGFVGRQREPEVKESRRKRVDGLRGGCAQCARGEGGRGNSNLRYILKSLGTHVLYLLEVPNLKYRTSFLPQAAQGCTTPPLIPTTSTGSVYIVKPNWT